MRFYLEGLPYGVLLEDLENAHTLSPNWKKKILKGKESLIATGKNTNSIVGTEN